MNRKFTAAIAAVLAALLLVPLAVHGAAGTGEPGDLRPGSWYCRYVEFCLERGYMGLAGEGAFEPDAPLTRGELALVVYALCNSPTFEFDDPELDPDYPFCDLERGGRYTDAVVSCFVRGLFAGRGDGTFGASLQVTRQELAVVLFAVARYKGFNVSARASLDAYPDAGDADAWASDALAWCVARGVISGTCDHGVVRLSPRDAATRAQIAAVAASFRSKVMDAELNRTAAGNYILGGGTSGGYSDDYLVYDEMIALTGKDKPTALYIGFAVEDSHGEDFCRGVFAVRGCPWEVLYEQDLGDPDLVREKVDKADMVYVGGGSTVRLVALLKQYGVDSLLRDAAARGVVMAGASAGAICFCESGMSWTDIRHSRVDGISCLDFLCCPHASTEPERYAAAREQLKTTPYMKCVALDGASIEVSDGMYRAIYTSEHSQIAEICELRDGAFVTTPISTTDWRPVSDLFF